MKINKLEIENVKRVKAVRIRPSENGLTIIGGDNEQGKTSVLDAIAYALGGEKYRPTNLNREGSVVPGTIKIIMDNGLIVERKGKNAALKVTDPTGKAAGQRLLDQFIEKLALDLPKFMEASGKEKADTLLQIIGVGPQLDELNRKEKELFDERTITGRTADRKTKYAAEQPYYPDVPAEPVSPMELIQKQQAILAKNGENQRKRERLNELVANKHRVFDEAQLIEERIAELQKQLDEKKSVYEQLATDEDIARTDVAQLQDESTAELEESLANIEEINRKVRANLDKEKAEEEAKGYSQKYIQLSNDIEQIRQARRDLLSSADLPLPGLSIENGELVYKGQKWDGISGAQRLIISTAIIRKLNPQCGFVLMDKLEQMDLRTLNEFNIWLEQEGLQVIATRVSTGDECSIIIEDGYGVQPGIDDPDPEPAKKTAPKAGGWKIGGNK
jgi:hypothetical protein